MYQARPTKPHSPLYWTDTLVALVFAVTAAAKLLVISGLSSRPEANLPDWAEFLHYPITHLLAIIIEGICVFGLLFAAWRAMARFFALGISALFLMLATGLELRDESIQGCGCFGSIPLPDFPRFLILVGLSLLCIAGIQRGAQDKGEALPTRTN